MTETDVSTSFRETYLIPLENVPTLSKKIAKLNAKAEKLGVAAISWDFGEYVIRGGETDENGNMIPLERLVEFVVTGEEPKYAGWTFLATLQFLYGVEAGVIIRAVPGVTVPEEFRTKITPWCDHCKTTRNRKDTYVVVDESGKHLEVGSSCVHDFLGHGDPHRIAAHLELLYLVEREFRALEGYGDGGSRVSYHDIHNYLPYAVSAVFHYGWVSVKKAENEGRVRTSSVASSHFGGHFSTPCRCKRGMHNFNLDPDEKDEEIAGVVVSEVLALGGREGLSDWEHNLLTLFKAEVMEDRNFGLVTSAVLLYFNPMWDRERAEKEATRPSEHLGTLLARLEGLDVELVEVIPTASDFGALFVLKFVDTEGNKLVWFTGKSFEPGFYTLTGTVKRHTEWKGIKETAVNRCKLVERDA